MSRTTVAGALLALLPFPGQGGGAQPVLPPPSPGPAVATLVARLRSTTGDRERVLFAARSPRRAVVGIRATGDFARLRARRGVRTVSIDRSLRFAVVVGRGAQLAALERQSWVRYVAPVRRLRATAIDDPFALRIDPATGMPFEWQLAAAHADDALRRAPGDPRILIGVVDTGVDRSNPDLVAKVAGELGGPGDDVGHGTFVAALAAGAVGNGAGIAGFGGASRLYVVRDNLYADFSLATSIRFAVDRGIRVLNLSFGGFEESPALADALTYAAERGVLTVASAGNDGSSFPAYPAAYLQPPGSRGSRSLGLSVGASDQLGHRAPWSNYGASLSLLAPGAWASDTCPELGVFSAVPAGPSSFDVSICANLLAVGSGRWGYGQGTSFAAPEVAGAAALIWSVNPAMKNFQVGDVLKESASRPAGSGWTPEGGWGVLDVAAALELARRYDSEPPSAQLRLPGRVWSKAVIPIRFAARDRGFRGNRPSGTVSYELRYRVDGGPERAWRSFRRPGTARFRGRLGSSYVFLLNVTDGAGNVAVARAGPIALRAG